MRPNIMSRTKYFIQEGLIVKKYNNDDKDVPGLFSLDKFFKKMLTRYHVPFVDDCCPTTTTTTTAAPVTTTTTTAAPVTTTTTTV